MFYASKKDTNIKVKRKPYQELNALGLRPGMNIFLTGIKVTQKTGFSRVAIATILEADPEYKRLEASLGEAKAKQYVRLALSAAVRLEKTERQQGLSQQRQQLPDLEL